MRRYWRACSTSSRSRASPPSVNGCCGPPAAGCRSSARRERPPAGGSGSVILAVLLAAATGQPAERPPEGLTEVHAVRLTEPVKVDGILSEEVWRTAPPAAAFLQRDPTEGAAPSEKTEVRIAYDD